MISEQAQRTFACVEKCSLSSPLYSVMVPFSPWYVHWIEAVLHGGLARTSQLSW